MVDIGYGYTDSEGSEGFIDQTVFEVFWDNNYIIAKRYPNLDKKIIEYYIAKKVKDDIKLAVKNRFGPYNLKQFDTKLKEFKLDTNEMEHKLFDYLK